MGASRLYLKDGEQTSTGVPEVLLMLHREPAVAGLFYPASPEVLRRSLENFLQGDTQGGHPAPKALIVPHAGYIYSGAVAAAAYRRLLPLHDAIDRVALLAPAHRVWLDGMAVPSVAGFATPLGRVPIDAMARTLVRDLPRVTVDDEAHREEHALEVQLPFLQMVLDDFEVLPIVVGRCPPADVAAVIDRVWDGPRTLIIVSSDLSHYRAYEDARRRDVDTSQRIRSKATSLSGDEACGAAAINGLMASAHARELTVELMELCNSGDTAGDHSRVVGYGAWVLY
jgi:AmmeMemoRadiSam system protein B